MAWKTLKKSGSKQKEISDKKESPESTGLRVLMCKCRLKVAKKAWKKISFRRTNKCIIAVEHIGMAK
jgi:hypothetical protein